jgi:hypothetical protein
LAEDDSEPADLIFVLAGHRTRKIFGALLVADGRAPAVLMSTGNPPFIARLLLAEAADRVALDAHVWVQVREAANGPPPPAGQFFASLDSRRWSAQSIPVGRLGTLSEIRAFASWLAQRPDIRRVLVVSSGLHLRRLRMCCRRLIPRDRSLRYVAARLTDEALAARGERRELETPALVLLESAKVLLYGFLLPFVGRASTASDRKSRHA